MILSPKPQKIRPCKVKQNNSYFEVYSTWDHNKPRDHLMVL